MYFDAHNHLHDEWLLPFQEELLRSLPDQGLRGAVVNGTSTADWESVTHLCARTNWLIPSFGLHPWLVGNREPDWLTKLEAYLVAHPHAGIGECGLDRWILDRAKPDERRLQCLRRASLEEQLGVFKAQLGLAHQLKRPCSIHCVDAWGLLLDTLSAHGPLPHGFLLHAYSGSAEQITEFVKLGARFSFNGSFLAPRRQNLREIFNQIPFDRLLVETDSPAMIPPANWRVQEFHASADIATLNHPSNILGIYRGLSELRKVPLPELQAVVAKNFAELFQISSGTGANRP